MNERIQELADKAGFNPVNYMGGNLALFEKFTELIVRECIKAYNDDGYQTEYEQDLKVLKHFGVEE